MTSDHSPAPRWVEPTSLLPLRWGRYRPRVVVGLALIAVGIASVQITTAYSLQFLGVGTLLQAIGWTVLPSAGWRRVTALVPAVGASCLLLGGGGYAGSFAVILAAWLLVRHRPLVTFPLVIAPILLGATVSGVLAGGIVVDYSSSWMVLTGGGLLSIGCTWAARAFAVGSSARRAASPGSTAPEAASPGPTASEAPGLDATTDALSGAHGTISRETGDLR